MTHDDIESYIDSLNQNNFGSFIFRSKLSDNVDYAKVWPDEPRGDISNEGSYDFYFVKNDKGVYVAAVADMYSDLHVFVKEEHRKKGYLSKAINESILPHICSKGRKKQVVTFEDPLIGEYVVKNWGFTLINNTKAERDLECFKEGPALEIRGYKLSYSDFELIRTKIGRARLYITMVKEQLDASLGQLEDSEIDFFEHELLNLDDYVLGLIERVQGQLA